MICMNYDHNKKFGLLKLHAGYGNCNLKSPKGYGLKVIHKFIHPIAVIYNTHMIVAVKNSY